MSIRFVLLALLALLACAAGCTSTAPVVDVDFNRHIQPVAFSTYSILIEKMPGFLVPFMRDELVAALTARGATEVAADADVEFRLRFRQVLLAGDVPSRDEPAGTTRPEDTTRFIAQVELSAMVKGAEAPSLVGKISRVHTVSAGRYMHPRAHTAIRKGFDRLLDTFVAPRPQ